jgi:hypothetical protein
MAFDENICKRTDKYREGTVIGNSHYEDSFRIKWDNLKSSQTLHRDFLKIITLKKSKEAKK